MRSKVSKADNDLRKLLSEKRLKGDERPINPQTDRAQVLSSISYVDYVLILPEMKTNNDYDLLMRKIKPNIITTTKNDPQSVHNERQAKEIGAKVIYVISKIKNKSTTNIANLIIKHFEK